MRLSISLSFCFYLLLLSDTTLMGLTIKVDRGLGGTPPNFTHNSTSITPLSIPVQLHNESPSTLETVLLWQIKLEVKKGSGATGDVEIVGFGSPSMPFLDSFGIGTNPPNSLPNTSVFFVDADASPPPALPGKNILAGETRDLMSINLASLNQAQGTFHLVMQGFDPITGSAWSGLSPPPNAFANVPGGTLPGEIVLAELTFVVPEPNTFVLIVSAATFVVINGRRRFKRMATTMQTCC